MKTKIFLLLLFMSSVTFAQVPTDQIMRYDFTGGNLTNQANLGVGDLTQQGTTASFIADRNGSVGDALKVSFDSFWGGATSAANHSNVTLAFWLKLDNPTSYVRSIINVRGGGSNNGIQFGSTNNSSLYLTIDTQGGIETSTVYIPSIFDNQWHFIVIKTQATWIGGIYGNVIQGRVFIDDVENTSFVTNGDLSGSTNTPNFMDSGQLVISPTQSFRYGIDDISYFERAISPAEMTALMGWTPPAPLQLLARTYVDKNATGANNGTSWADAFTDLNDGLHYVNTNGEVWIAGGTYKPDASDITKSFLVDKTGISVYGGFAGTEATLADRDLTLGNETILSGDLSGNDNTNILFVEPSRTDNSYHVVEVVSNGIILDGLTISDGHAIGSLDDRMGAAVFKNPSVDNLTVKNCKINNNVNILEGSITANFDTAGSKELNIFNCIFDNNLARFGAGFHSESTISIVVVKVYSSLFINNTTANTNNANGYSGSAFWLRARDAGGYNSIYEPYIQNCTFANNHEYGAGSATKSTVGLSRSNFGVISSASRVANCIFYGNTDQSNVTVASIEKILSSENIPYGLAIRYSIDENNFPYFTNRYALSTADPLFIDAANNNFRLQSGSPAIDAGSNNYLDADMTLDVNQANRILNTTVDMGAYEYFTLTPYTLTTTVNGSGTVNPAGTNTYYSGDHVIITATPAAGYQFDHWTGDASGNTNPLTVTMNSDKSIEAVFIQVQRSLTTSAIGSGAVTPSGVTIHNDGATVSVSAMAATGWQFDNWSGDASGTTSPINVVMNADKNIVANFSQIQYELTLVSNAGGASLPDSGTLTGGVYQYVYGTNVNINATANTGYVFDHFNITDTSGTVTTSTSNPVMINMSENFTVEPIFVQVVQRTLTTSVGGYLDPNDVDGGTVTAGGTYNDGDNAVITATANSGLSFVEFYVYNTITGTGYFTTSNPLTINMDADYQVSAKFNNVKLITFVDNAIEGSITPQGTAEYAYNSSVTISSTANAGYVFEKFEAVDSNSGDTFYYTANPLSLTIDKLWVVKPIFQIERTLITSVNGNGTVSPNGTTMYSDGDTVIITATPAAGYQFDHWTGDASGSASPLSVTMNADKSIEAVFTQVQRTLTTSAIGSGAVTPSGVTTYNDGTSVSVSAMAATGWQFDNWSGDASGTISPINVTMNADKNIVANFSQIQYELTLVSNTGGAALPDFGTLTGGAYQYVYGTNVNITATANTGYVFDHFNITDENATVTTSTSNPVMVNITENLTIEPIFVQIQRILTTTVNGSGAVTPSGTNAYSDGDVVTVTATAATGWQFNHWTGDASGNTNPLSITMDTDKSIEAVFTIMQFTLTTSVDGNGTVSPSGVNNYNYGDTLTISATPDTGNSFVRFDITDSTGTTISTDITINIVIGEDISVIAVFQSTAGIDETKILNFNIYPNPVSDMLNITSDNNVIKEVVIYDSLGRLILKTNQNKVSVSKLSSGIYYVKVQSINSNTAIKKFLKR